MKEFVTIAFDSNNKTFVVLITTFNMSFDSDTKVYFLKKTYIAYFKVDKTFQEVTSKYVKFRDIFLPKLFVKFSKHININNHIIELVYN